MKTKTILKAIGALRAADAQLSRHLEEAFLRGDTMASLDCSSAATLLEEELSLHFPTAKVEETA